jgi:hypothetical protein
MKEAGITLYILWTIDYYLPKGFLVGVFSSRLNVSNFRKGGVLKLSFMFQKQRAGP